MTSSCNGSSHVRRQAITWTNTDIFSIRLLGTKRNEISVNKKLFGPEDVYQNVVYKMAVIFAVKKVSMYQTYADNK